jgi:hypothetical protein
VTPQEAVEATCELLGRLLSSAGRHDGAEYGRWFRRLEMRSSLPRLRELFDPAKHDEFAKLVEDARKGNDPEADAELCEWGALAVSSAGNIPLPLRRYIADKLLEQAEAARRKRGQHPDTFLLRNFSIMYAVARLSERGFHPTRNPAQRSQESACSIVTVALGRVGTHMSEDNVEKVWGQRSQLPSALREYIEGEARIPNGSIL